MADIMDHPNSKLATRIKEQEEIIHKLLLDIEVLKDLVRRTVSIVKKIQEK